MTEPWKDANYAIPESHLTGRFWFQSWADFLNQSVFESQIWQTRGIRLLSWSVSTQKDLQTIQIIFTVNRPTFEMMYFEVIVKDSDKEGVHAWLAERVPPFWKNIASA